MVIEGLDKLLNILDSSIKGFDVEIPKRLNKVSSKLIRKVKLKTPVGKVKGGTLRRSWRVKKDGDLTRIVYNNIHYAPHVEYGHRTRLGTGKGKPKGKIKVVEGRYMLTKSVQEIEGTLTSEFSIMIENLFND